MKVSKLMSIGVFCVGIALLGVSYYIQNEVAHGRMQVEAAQTTLQRGKALFSLTPTTNQIGEGIERSANRKIGEAKQEIAYYANLAQILLVGGYILVVAGVGLFIVALRRPS